MVAQNHTIICVCAAPTRDRIAHSPRCQRFHGSVFWQLGQAPFSWHVSVLQTQDSAICGKASTHLGNTYMLHSEHYPFPRDTLTQTPSSSQFREPCRPCTMWLSPTSRQDVSEGWAASSAAPKQEGKLPADHTKTMLHPQTSILLNDPHSAEYANFEQQFPMRVVQSSRNCSPTASSGSSCWTREQQLAPRIFPDKSQAKQPRLTMCATP